MSYEPLLASVMTMHQGEVTISAKRVFTWTCTESVQNIASCGGFHPYPYAKRPGIATRICKRTQTNSYRGSNNGTI